MSKLGESVTIKVIINADVIARGVCAGSCKLPLINENLFSVLYRQEKNKRDIDLSQQSFFFLKAA